MKKLLTIALLSVASACTPANEQYCNSFGLAKTNPEYSACQVYYSKMSNWFGGDLNSCQGKASLAYPEYMYDHPRYAETQSIDPFGHIRTSNTMIEPDYMRNQSLDNERRKIIAPCMAERGWISPDSWQAGRIGANAPAPHF